MSFFKRQPVVKPLGHRGSSLTADGVRASGKAVIHVGNRARFVFVMAACSLCFGMISLRLVEVAAVAQTGLERRAGSAQNIRYQRPDLMDRNDIIMAKDLNKTSLYADSTKIIDIDEVVEKLTAVLPDLDPRRLRAKLSHKSKFIWIKRGLTPRQHARIFRLGLPGLEFERENSRVYPNGQIAAHILGHVNVDNKGTAGIEKYIDTIGLSNADALAPVKLSIDLRVQHAVREELVAAMQLYKAKAVSAVVLDVHTGEVLAMSSLPDYDPNDPAKSLNKNTLNRMTAGVYELGSVFKAFTVAMALDSGVATLKSKYDARKAIRAASFKIDDFHAKRRILTVPEVFIYSSNIGAAKIALDVGRKRQKAFLKRLGLLTRLQTELPESRQPMFPKTWRPVNVMTIGYGHGLAVSPLQAASAAAALVNGGKLITPTFLKRSEAVALFSAKQVLKPETSADMRYLMRLNVTKGTARKADVPGYLVGGKTGTAEKATRHGYSKNKLLTSFMGTFPTNAPKYVILVVLDEPKGLKQTHGYATSGWNAAPVTAKIVARIAPMLGVLPEDPSVEIFRRPVLAAFDKEPR